MKNIIKIQNLKKKYNNINNINFVINKIIIYTTKTSIEKIYTNDYKVNCFQYLMIIFKLKKFLSKKPLSQVLKNIDILNLNFYVNKNVLTPRFETEELIYNSIYEINNFFTNSKDKKIIFDIGTGSLVIAACFWKYLKKTIIWASDISKKALKVAKINNKKLANNKIKIIKSNVLDFYLKNNLKCNVLVSNPPYVSKNYELDEYTKNDPKISLFAENNGLFFYQKILKDCKKVLLNKSIIIFEFGYNQKDEIEKIIKENLPNQKFIFKKDINNKWRFVYIYYLI